MDELSVSIPWPAIPVIFGLAVAGVVWGLQKLKMLAWSSKRWTRHIPKWIWLSLSIVLPFGLVIFLAQPWVFGWLNLILPASMQVDLGPQEMLGIGVSAVFGGQGAYPLAKKMGLTADYSDIENGYVQSKGGADSQSGNGATQNGNVGANGTMAAEPEGSLPDAGSIPAASTEPLISDPAIQGSDVNVNNVDTSPEPVDDVDTSSEVYDPVPHDPERMAYLLRYTDIGRPGYVVLSPDGKLYRMHNGKAEHLPNGWQDSA